jgi:hypothetical protein
MVETVTVDKTEERNIETMGKHICRSNLFILFFRNGGDINQHVSQGSFQGARTEKFVLTPHQFGADTVCQQPALPGVKYTVFHVLVKAFLGGKDP